MAEFARASAAAMLLVLGAGWAAAAGTVRPEAYEAFLAEKPYLTREDEKARRALGVACAALDRRCLLFLDSHRDTAQRAIPDNPRYWERFGEVLTGSPRPQDPSSATDFEAGRLLSATRDWPIRELLSEDGLGHGELHVQLAAHRRLLAESPFLIDKMVYLATTGMAAASLNVLMARTDGVPTSEQAGLLSEMLAPLTIEERSLRRVMAGEKEYLMARLAEQPEPPEVDPLTLGRLLDVYGYIADRSEATWEDYWRGGLDPVADLPGYTIPEAYVPNFASYTSNMHHVDALLHVLRGLREVYEGRQSPGVPGLAPLAHWHWQWQWRDDVRTLCLAPVDVHPSLGDSNPICVEYLTSDPAQRDAARNDHQPS